MYFSKRQADAWRKQRKLKTKLNLRWDQIQLYRYSYDVRSYMQKNFQGDMEGLQMSESY